jgi:signal transduction histidine kinase
MNTAPAPEPNQDPAGEETPRGPWPSRLINSLAGRLLGLTILVVLLAEILVFAPSLARFHADWLRERANLAYVSALATRDSGAAPALERRLLAAAQAQYVTLEDQDGAILRLGATPPPANLRQLDFTEVTGIGGWVWAMQTLWAPPGRNLEVIVTPARGSGDRVTLVLPEAPLQRATRAYALELAGVSTLVSVLAGALVYGVLIYAFVRPMRRLTRNIERFRRRPSDATRFMPISRRRDEIGRAERAIRVMQAEIQSSLRQRERLAEMGGAMARVAHDLRNMLATAQLVTQRIASSTDPEVRAAAPRLERSIGRAAGLAASALRYGKAEETPQVFRAVSLEAAANEAFAEALAGFSEVKGQLGPGAHAQVIADPDHLHRLLVNLIRNAAQAVRTASAHDPDHPRRITVSSQPSGAKVAIRIADTGCGVPAHAVKHLFEPFVSGRGGEGSGLGLAIARELARAQGGELELITTGPQGATFQLTLPAA